MQLLILTILYAVFKSINITERTHKVILNLFQDLSAVKDKKGSRKRTRKGSR